MDLSLSEEEHLIQSMAQRIGREFSSELDFDQGSEGAWAALRETGLNDLRTAADRKDGLGATATRVVIHELAKCLFPVPYLGHYLGSDLVARGRDEDTQRKAAGSDDPLVPAFDRSLSRLACLGEEIRVPDGSSNATILVRAECAKGTKTVTAKFTLERLNNLDLGRYASRGVPGEDGSEHETLAIDVSHSELERWRAFALTMIAADMVGAMDGALQLAIDYASQRKQFGTQIGAFQAVQHLLAEQKVGLAAADHCVQYAAWAVDEAELDEALLAACTAKAMASRAGRQLVEAALQVHGGIGMTWECDVHRFLRRVNLDRVVLGDENRHYEEVALLRRQRVDPALHRAN